MKSDLSSVLPCSFSPLTARSVGGFNANVIKLLQQTIDEYHAKGLTDKDIVIYP